VTRTGRLLSGAIAALLTVALVAPSAPAAASTVVAGIPIVGRTYTVWKAAGGTTKLGKPVAARVASTIGGRTAYLQRFTKGQVFSSGLGTQTVLYPATISLTGVVNERDALARYGFARGALLRTAQLSGVTKRDALKLATELRGGLVIDLRASTARRSYPDPKLPRVTHLSIGISPDTNYPKYVTSPARRTAFAAALRAAAASKGTVLIHCTAGRDRTGWAVAMLMYSLGASDNQVMAEYLRTKGTHASTLRGGLNQAITSYGSIANYLRAGLGLTDADFHALKAKFA
jgi:protein-tyrosine phosphatase